MTDTTPTTDVPEMTLDEARIWFAALAAHLQDIRDQYEAEQAEEVAA